MTKDYNPYLNYNFRQLDTLYILCAYPQLKSFSDGLIMYPQTEKLYGTFNSLINLRNTFGIQPECLQPVREKKISIQKQAAKRFRLNPNPKAVVNVGAYKFYF